MNTAAANSLSHTSTTKLMLQFKNPLYPWMASKIVKSWAEMILYSRQILPLPADTLLREYHHLDDDANNKQTSIKDRFQRRKMNQLAEDLSFVLQVVTEVFEVLNDHFAKNIGPCSHLNNKLMQKVVMTLGPSFLSPREQYIINFETCSIIRDNKMSLEQKILAIESELKRRTGRECIKIPPASLALPPSCKVNFAFFVSKEFCESLLNNNKLSKVLRIDQKFKIKTPTPVNRRKGILRPFVVLDIHTNQILEKKNKQSDRLVEQVLNDNYFECGVWVTLRRGMKSFRM